MKKPLHADAPRLWRLGPAAKKAGITPAAFAEASAAGRIPVRVIQLSARGRYVPAAELAAWLATLNNKEENQ